MNLCPCNTLTLGGDSSFIQTLKRSAVHTDSGSTTLRAQSGLMGVPDDLRAEYEARIVAVEARNVGVDCVGGGSGGADRSVDEVVGRVPAWWEAPGGIVLKGMPSLDPKRPGRKPGEGMFKRRAIPSARIVS